MYILYDLNQSKACPIDLYESHESRDHAQYLWLPMTVILWSVIMICHMFTCVTLTKATSICWAMILLFHGD